MDELASPSARREQRRRAALDGAGGEGGAEPGRNSRNRALSDALDQGPGNSSPEPPTSTVSPPERTQLQQASRRRPSLLTSPTASRDGEPASPMGRMRRCHACCMDAMACAVHACITACNTCGFRSLPAGWGPVAACHAPPPAAFSHVSHATPPAFPSLLPMRRGQAARRRGAGPASHDSGSERSFRMGRGGHREVGGPW